MRKSCIFATLVLSVLLPVEARSQTGSAAADAISRENRARAESYAGNSVDTGTGAFVLSETVISVQGARSLNFTLNYNSLLTNVAGSLGRGWSHEFEGRIEGDPQDVVTVYWDLNRKNSFRFAASGADYTPLDESSRYDRLVRASTGIWTLTRLDGTVYTFAANGDLTSVANKVQQTISPRRTLNRNLMYDVREDVAGRLLDLTLTRDGANRIQSVKDGANRVVYFEYDSNQQLSKLRPPVTLDTQEYGAPFVPKSVPDNNPAGVTHTISVSRTSPIGLVELTLANLSHQRPTDLVVTVISPRGTQARIANPVPDPLTSSTVAWDLSGMMLSQFDGENPQGDWRVVAVDSQAGSLGTMNGWIMRFTGPTDPITYAYDSAGRITTATGPDGERLFANTYDANGRVVAQDDGLDSNMLATFSYQTTSSGGVMTNYRDRTGGTHVYEHDSRYHLMMYADPLGNATRYNYDASGNRIRITDPLNRATIFGYDQTGNLTSVVDPGGYVWTMSYDSRRNLTSFRDPLGRTSNFQYDSRNNLTRVTDALGHSDNKTYSANSQLVGNLMSDGAGINYGYSNGMPSSASHPGGGGSAGTQYDNIGRLTRLSDPDGYASTFVYDSQSRVISKGDALGQAETKSYDRLKRVSQQTDRRGNRTTYKYDNNDNVIEAVDPLGFSTRFEYDGEDRLVRTIDPNGNVQTVTYDASGRKISERDPGGATASYSYDAAGNLLAVRDSSGTITGQYAYDARDLQTEVTDAAGAKTTHVMNEVRRPTEIRDPLNRTTAWVYDALDRLIEVRDPMGRRATQSYLADDVVANINDARGNGVSFSYDGANRISAIRQNGDSASRIYSYNGRDLITTENQSGGTRRYDYTYDSAGRLLSVTRRPVASTTPSTTISYRYDQNGNTTEVLSSTNNQTPVIRLTRGYDPLDRMTRFTDGRGNTLLYSFDPGGNLKELTYPDGRKVTYSYDSANRMTGITDWAGRNTRYVYDENGRMIRAEMPNGTLRLMTYDATGQMIRRRELAANGGVIADVRYSYDPAGQIFSETGGMAGTTSPPPVSLTYDAANRIVTVDGQTAQNDTDGNLIQFKNRTYQYDLNNNLISADNVTYSYDEEDRLIGFSDATGATTFVVNPAASLSQILVRTSPGGTVTRYVYGAGLVYEESGGVIRTYHFDIRGSTIALADGTGNVTQRVQYGPYGETLPGSDAIDSPFSYHGLFGVVSGPTGLRYMRFRWYSPELKRFLNRDAHYGDISQIDSLNRFGFAGGAPILRVDPEGQFWWVAAGAIVGAVAAVAVKAASDMISGKFSGWQSYAGAAIGGAVTGAALALCPACGISAGALGAAAAYGAEKGFRGERVDAGELLMEAAVGGLAGGVAGGGGKLTAKLAGKAAGRLAGGSVLGKFSGSLFGGFGKSAARRAVFGRADIIRQSLKREIPLGFVRGAVASATSQLVTLTGVAALGDRFLLNVSTLWGGVGSNEGATGADTTKPNIWSDSRLEVNSKRKSAYGEFIHWNFWVNSLQLAGRPLPNNPNNLLTSF